MTPPAHTGDTCTPTVQHAIGVEAATSVARTLKALAEPLRLRMLSAIATDPRGESCVCDLAELANVSQPTVSHHLKVMKDAGILTSDRRGTWVWYRIVPSRKQAVTALLDSFAPATLREPAEDAADRAEDLRTMDTRVSRLAGELADELADMNRELVVTTVRESYAGLVRSTRLTRHLPHRALRTTAARRSVAGSRDIGTPGAVRLRCECRAFTARSGSAQSVF